MSEAWVAWAMFLLLALLVLNRFFVTDIALVIRGLYSRSERSYTDVSWQAKILAGLYRIGIVTLLLYFGACTSEDCTLQRCLVCLGVVGVILLLQYALVWFVGKVFMTDRQLEASLEFRTSICNAISVLLWPLALFLRLSSSQSMISVMAAVMLGLLVLLLMWKSVQLFCKNLLSVFYILLYVSVLEVVPLLVAFYVINQLL